MLDEQVAELEDGFRHLLDGLRAIIKVLRDENALLTARLDERRLMAGVVAAASVVVPEAPAPVPMVENAVPVVRKPCERCHDEITVRQATRFCRWSRCQRRRNTGISRVRPCFAILAGERLRKSREEKRDKLTEEIDMRIAVSQ